MKLSNLNSIKFLQRGFVLLLLLLFTGLSYGTHLVGGFLSYRFVGSNGSFNTYRVTLYVYRDCIKDNTDDEVPFDEEIKLCVFRGTGQFYDDYTLPLRSEKSVDPVGNTSCPEVASACLKQGIYEANISVPNSSSGYHLKWERCCRNTQNNLRDDNTGTPYQGQTYYGFIPATSLQNSSPYFLDIPVPFICANDTTTIRNRAVDPDGDSLSYRLVTPWQGANDQVPIIQSCASSYVQSPDVNYVTGYNASRPFGTGGVATIDNINGLTTYMAKNTGRYAVAIEVTEWRNGVKISSIRLDLQILVINCQPNNKPRLNYEGGTKVWFVEAGDQICKDITGIDDVDDDDKITVRGYGDVFGGVNWTGSKATLSPNPAVGIKRATTRFCWKTDCDQASSVPYPVTFEAFDDGCPSKFVNENVLIYVTPFSPRESITGPVNVCMNSVGVLYSLRDRTLTNTYVWRVEGGTIVGDSTLPSISVNWGNSTIGKISVWIISQFGCKVGPREYTVNLQPSPSKPKISGSDTVCLNSTFTYNSTAEAGVSYSWKATGGTILGSSSSSSVNVRWNVLGDGYVTLVVSNSLGCPSPADTFLVHVSKPTTFDLEGPISVCPNNREIGYWVPNPSKGSLYRWTIVGGVQHSGGMGDSILVNWGGLGTGYVKVVEINKFGCIGDTVSLMVIKNHALAGQLPKGDTSFCEFSKGLVYTISPVNGETYEWIITGGTIVSGQNTESIVVDWGASGIGSVGVRSTAYDSISGLPCLSPIRARMVHLRPYPQKQNINGDFDICQSESNIILSINGLPGSTYTWEINGLSFIGQGTNSTTVFADTFGSFSVRVKEMSQYGCEGPWNDTVLVIHPKPVTSNISGDFVICAPRYNGYVYSATGFVNSTYQWWLKNGVFTTASNSNVVGVNWNGTQISEISVLETSEFGCIGDTIKSEVFIDNPQVEFRLVTVDPPPASDKNVLVYFNVSNAPRYNNRVFVQRKPRGSAAPFATIGSVDISQNSYTDATAMTDSMSYDYRVVAVNLCGDSLYSDQHTDIVLKGLKTGPFSYRLWFDDYLGWPAGVAQYELYRAFEGKSGFTLVGTYPTAPALDQFDNGKDHYGQYFRVKAIENGGLGRESWSNEVRVYFDPVIFIPNAYSPDGNNLNETFLPSSGGLKTYKFRIYNRWGEKLFETSSTEKGWDGIYNGKLVPSGVYVYVVDYSDFKDKQYSAKGTVHLIR